MNIKYILIALLFATTASSYGQRSSEVGILGGPTLVFLRGNEVIEQYGKPVVSFSAGAFFQHHLSEKFSIRADFMFERKGMKSDAPFTNISGVPLQDPKGISRLDYITLPLLLRLSFGKKNGFFINAGPYFGYLLKHIDIIKTTDLKYKLNFTDWDHRFDCGFSAGLGFKIPIKNSWSLSFELRNNLGLYDVSKVSVVNNGTVKTNSLSLLVSFGYKL